MSIIPEFLTPAEAARYLGIPVTAVQALVAKGRLPVVNIQGGWRIRRDALDERRETFQWTKPEGAVALVNLDNLSEIVMEKAASRFGLSTKGYDTGDAALHAVALGECSVVLLNEELPDMDTCDCYAELRGISMDLPAVVMCEKMVAEDYRRFLFRGGPVTFIHRPVQYQHAERLFRQLRFERGTLETRG